MYAVRFKEYSHNQTIQTDIYQLMYICTYNCYAPNNQGILPSLFKLTLNSSNENVWYSSIYALNWYI